MTNTLSCSLFTTTAAAYRTRCSCTVVWSIIGRVSVTVVHFLLRETKVDRIWFYFGTDVLAQILCQRWFKFGPFGTDLLFPVRFEDLSRLGGRFHSLPPKRVAIQQHSVTYELSCFPPPEIGWKSSKCVVRIFRSRSLSLISRWVSSCSPLKCIFLHSSVRPNYTEKCVAAKNNITAPGGGACEIRWKTG